MISRILARFGLAVVNLDDVARRMARHTLDVNGYALHTLERSGTERDLQVRYVRIAVETGLPANIARQVARMAWRYVEDAQRDPLPVNRDGFSLYE